MARSDFAELIQRVAELERKLDNTVRHGPVEDRKKIDGQWFIRARIGGTDEKPLLSPWRPYVQPSGGKAGFNMQVVPAKGEQVTLLSPAGDMNQGVFQSFWWSDKNKALSDDPDQVVIEHRGKVRLSIKDGVLSVEKAKQIVLNAESGVTIKAPEIVLEGEVYLGGKSGAKPVHRKTDIDSAGDVAVKGSSRVFAVD